MRQESRFRGMKINSGGCEDKIGGIDTKWEAVDDVLGSGAWVLGFASEL